MALRVLLADESVTIKKAFELALQDYGVDIVSVNAGVDVVPVAMKFKPDIIFADVLLQKKNGYDLCKELKSLDDTKATPVVLIWSGFMDLDKTKFKDCGANEQLEKPFDTDRLRQLVQKLVPRLSSQKLSSYLEFPKMPNMEEASLKEAPPSDLPELTQAGSIDTSIDLGPLNLNNETKTQSHKEELDAKSWNMDQFESLQAPEDEPDDFLEMPLQPDSNESTENESSSADLDMEDDSETPWVSQTLTQFKMDKNKLSEPDEVSFEVPDDKIDADSLISNHDSLANWSGKPSQEAPPPLTQQKRSEPAITRDHSQDADETGLELEFSTEETLTPIESAINERQIEAIIKAQAREIIEKVIWEVVPEIATQVIEREIQKLLNEKNDH